MAGREPIVISHKAHLSFPVKIVQLFPSLGSAENSLGEDGLAHKRDSCSCRGICRPNRSPVPSEPLPAPLPALTRSCSGSKRRALERLFRMWVMFQRAGFFVWVNLVVLCVYEWVARWEPPQPVFASKTSAPDFSGHTMRARGQPSMLCRIKGRYEAPRQSLFWPATELAP